MSQIVCNAGPLIALAGIGQVDLLLELFGGVVVAEEVRREVEAGGTSELGRSVFEDHSWLQTVPLAMPPDPLLTGVLDAGEAATIALALQLGATHVLMDEAKGRKVACDVYQLAVIGTGRGMVEAKKAGLVPLVRPLVEQMRSNGYWLADRIVTEIHRQAQE